MDVFFEQIIKMKMTIKEVALYVSVWAAAGLLAFFALMFLGGSSFAFIAIVGLVFGAWKLSCKFFVEYEYIFTNGDLDFDKITAKSTRKRMASINCSSVEKYGKYNWASKPSTSVKKVYTFCNLKDPNAMYLIAPSRNEGTVLIVFAPEARIKEAIEKAIPRIAF